MSVLEDETRLNSVKENISNLSLNELKKLRHFIDEKIKLQGNNTHSKSSRKLNVWEELVLTTIENFRREAFANEILRFIQQKEEGNKSTTGKINITLNRLVQKGLISFRTEEKANNHPGRLKLYYCLLDSGREKLNEVRALREKISSVLNHQS